MSCPCDDMLIISPQKFYIEEVADRLSRQDLELEDEETLAGLHGVSYFSESRKWYYNSRSKKTSSKSYISTKDRRSSIISH